MPYQTQPVDDIFDQALRHEPGPQRDKFLREACGDDNDLKRRVQRLLRAVADAGSFLEEPAEDPSPTIDEFTSEHGNTPVGPYKVLEKIGQGGMGVVYMAEQQAPVKRRVALKIIKPGMDTQQVIARFEAERQALAMMDHPNIAKVLDAGATETGRPYFVMELVNGLPLTKYCDEQHLTTEQRLELFLPICHAVQHAHQKGIIHRDIKPSNILVAMFDGRPVPKIIDFGVAKATNQALTEKTMFTQLGQVVGTLEYMSPEQAERNQLDIDTRSDIYSLGVVLYELLTGETPIDRKSLRTVGLDDLLRMIREEEPPRPSTKINGSHSLPSIAANRQVEPQRLGSMIRGELDWIVMKAIEKDRARRYESANDFARDIQRYLNDETVEACSPSMAYRFSKFAKRNKSMIASGTLVALMLLIGTAGTIWQAMRAVRSEQQAQEQLQEVRKAQAETERALYNLSKTQAVALTSTASFLVEKKNYDEAVLRFKRALELDPASGMANNNYAWFLATCPDEQFRDPKRALECAHRAVELNPDSGYFHNTLGVAHFRTGDNAKAIEALKRSAGLMLDEAVSFNAFFLAMAYWQESDKDAAQKAYEQAVDWMEKHQPTDSELLRFYAEATERLNNPPVETVFLRPTEAEALKEPPVWAKPIQFDPVRVDSGGPFSEY